MSKASLYILIVAFAVAFGTQSWSNARMSVDQQIELADYESVCIVLVGRINQQQSYIEYLEKYIETESSNKEANLHETGNSL